MNNKTRHAKHGGGAGKLSRRVWLQWIAVFALLLALTCGGLLLYDHYTKSHFQITYYRIASSHVTEKLRIVFLSDLHLRQYGEDNKELLDEVQSLEPDLILLGGDFVTYPDPDYESMLSLCRKLARIAPSYAVLGNHESEMIYGGVDEKLAEKFAMTGITLLRNENKTIYIRSNKIELVGLEGACKDYDYYNYGASDCMERLSTQYDALRIVMDHVPMKFINYYQDYPFDIGFAGHTHGGLIRLPILGRLYSAEEGLFPQYAGGKYQLKNGAQFIVGCGLGDSSWVPRVYNPPELVLVDVNWY